MSVLEDAIRALDRGALVAYPTETVYGLGADATDETAVERVYAVKGRDREDPISVAVESVGAASHWFDLTGAEERFLEGFCPGPVTLVCSRPAAIPPVVTAGRDRVGVRIPDHPVALALLDRAAPITATSANPSGDPAPADPSGLDPSVREGVATVLPPNTGDIAGGGDAGAGPDADRSAGGSDRREPSTVVDVERGTIHRQGAMAGAVESFLEEQRESH